MGAGKKYSLPCLARSRIPGPTDLHDSNFPSSRVYLEWVYSVELEWTYAVPRNVG